MAEKKGWLAGQLESWGERVQETKAIFSQKAKAAGNFIMDKAEQGIRLAGLEDSTAGDVIRTIAAADAAIVHTAIEGGSSILFGGAQGIAELGNTGTDLGEGYAKIIQGEEGGERQVINSTGLMSAGENIEEGANKIVTGEAPLEGVAQISEGVAVTAGHIATVKGGLERMAGGPEPAPFVRKTKGTKGTGKKAKVDEPTPEGTPVTTERAIDATEATTNPAVQKGIDLIEESGADVKLNPKNSNLKQEGNVTLDFGEGSRVNVRVETHPIPGSKGIPKRHANIEVVEKVKNKNVVRQNIHKEE
jgi:hypothetical protein